MIFRPFLVSRQSDASMRHVLHIRQQRGGQAAQAEKLHDQGRFDEALALYRVLLAQDPLNVMLHHDYNDLLYRLDARTIISNPMTAPRPCAALFRQGNFLMHGDRYGDAERFLPPSRQARRITSTRPCARLPRATSCRPDEALVHSRGCSRAFRKRRSSANAAAVAREEGQPHRALALPKPVLPPRNHQPGPEGHGLSLLDDERDEH